MSYKIFDKSYLNDVVKTTQTPFYLYDLNLLKDTITKLKQAYTKYFNHAQNIHYAIKANNNSSILKFISSTNLGADCVSGGEILDAINNGFAHQDIVFAGVGKLDWEIELALNNDVLAFNSESLQEIYVINDIAKNLGKIAKIFIRINPDIDAKTHKHISTGMHCNKFGIGFNEFINALPEILALNNVQLIGLHYHIGSQITDNDVYKNLCLKINEHYTILIKHNLQLTDINLGGGLGIDYNQPDTNTIADFDAYFKTIATHLKLPKEVNLHFELGRSITAQCGVIISKVIFTKTTANTNFAIIDAGMNDLIRPALYEAKHKISTLNSNITTQNKYSIVGPICESSDVFATELKLPTLNRGDFVIIYSCGAYGRVLANSYNSRELIQEYFINEKNT